LKEIVATKKSQPVVSQTQKIVERMKRKKGKKNVIVDVLEEISSDPPNQKAFFQFRPYKQKQ